MLKAIVTDVDGVIIGKKQGVNFPLPNNTIIKALRDLHKKGIPIVLCTAKSSHVIKKIAKQADLRNPHISDAGALITNPINNEIIKKRVFDNELKRNIIEEVLSHNFYTEVYGVEEYYLQKNHISEFTEKRIQVLQKHPITFDSLLHKIDELEVIKIKVFAHNHEEKEKIATILEQFNEKAYIMWGHHPFTLPTQDINIT